jgi:fibronectin type III domain protein
LLMMAHQQKNEPVSMQLNKIIQKSEEVSMNCDSTRRPRHRVSPMLGISLGLCLSLLLIPTLSFATVMGDRANAMQPGTFVTLQTNGFSNGAILAPGGPTNFITQYADSAEWDPNRKKVHFLGQSHSNPIPTYVQYADSTNTWTVIANPITSTVAHAYDHNAVDTNTGDFYYYEYNSTTIRKWTASTQAWSSFSIPAGPRNITGGLEFFPEMNSLVFVEPLLGIWKYHIGTGVWTKISDPLPMGPYSIFLEYNPVHKVVIFGGGQNDRRVYKMDSGGSITRMGDAPVGLGVGDYESRISVDPVGGDYIVLKSNRQMYAYNVVNDKWTTLGVTYPSGDPTIGTIEASITTYGVIMFIHYDYSNSAVYLYKHSTGGGSSPPSDSTAPTVPPNTNATSSSSSAINVSWGTSSDNVGVTGYKIYRDGVQVGTSQTTSFTNASLAPSTSYTFTVSAFDAAGNESGQSTGSLATTLPPAPSGSGDLPSRCQATGVIKCFGFDDQASTDPFVFPPSGQTQKLGMVVTDIKASGAGSLRFTIPSNSPSDTSGTFWQNFSDDLATQFGEGGEFYVQWRQRFSADFLNTTYTSSNGFKQIIIGEGDRPGVTNYTCTQLEIVVQNSSQRGFPQMYHSCGGKDDKYEPLDVPVPPFDFALQNAVDGCLYSHLPNAVPPCVGYKPNQWMTYQIHVKVGKWYKNDKNYHRDSTIELWIAEEGQPSKLVISRKDYDIANTGNSAAKYGKLWLLPYQSGKSSAQSHPVGYVWYDDLIISTNKIGDPDGSSGGGGDSTPPAAPQNLKLTVQ